MTAPAAVPSAPPRISGIYSYQQAVSRKFSIKAGFEATYFQKASGLEPTAPLAT